MPVTCGFHLTRPIWDWENIVILWRIITGSPSLVIIGEFIQIENLKWLIFLKGWMEKLEG
jgi:hypothetical protein